MKGPWIRIGGVRRRTRAGIAALLAALVVAVLPLPSAPQARAATAEDSARTVSGVKGKYDDFSKLKVTVHQTENLRAQGVRVTWTGGKETKGAMYTDYLQIMQCWGDEPSGPGREQCEFGASIQNNIGGDLTASRSLTTSKAPDPEETQYPFDGVNPAFVPFRPATGEPATTSPVDHTYFSSIDTNEEPYALTHADGTGEVTFLTQTVREAGHLGCGDPVRTATTVKGKSCWLVVVPRGEHEPDGRIGQGAQGTLNSSPLTTSNWAQRLVFPLDFLPVGDTCPADRAERRVTGSELVTDAISSWQPVLCTTTPSKFTFSQRGEQAARDLITKPTDTSPGLGFTVEPAVPDKGSPPIIHAPVAVSGIAVAFFVEIPGVGQLKEMKLNARLVAKLLTASYWDDVPHVYTDPSPPAQIAGNPRSIFHDPEFQALNPRFATWERTASGPMSLMVQLDNTDTNRMVWHWLQSDAEAKAFLGGRADPWGMKINTYYKGLALGTDATRSDFPKADPSAIPLSFQGQDAVSMTITDLSPYVGDMHDGALRTRRGNNLRTTTPADGGPGLPTKLATTPTLSGYRMVMAITDTASAARYGLQTAALRNASGTYVAPTSASLLTAVGEMKDSKVAGVLAPDPARAKGSAYPLTAVTYAAASTGLDKSVRKELAGLIRYAAGAGQVVGFRPGQLPDGYAPLTAGLKARARAAADRLQNAVASGGDQGAASGSGGTQGSAGGGSSAGAASGGGVGGAGGSSANPDTHDSASPSAGPADPGKNKLAASGGLTPGGVLGVIRWVLLGVLVAGGVAALAGPVMLRLSVRKTA
ncbi:hypothetical protein [Streptomyces beijiangensis]|uniref:Uncharacterized protein n=1 Tax=Streptomyces beijiangensis TaxID=163361 RepID=A0A939FDN5_9ACTN|nr:hypothetical protein [Streptomyces beijiangensis]MBO0516098.1 hypothetical protein [Streptomyces beijiangensis]